MRPLLDAYFFFLSWTLFLLLGYRWPCFFFWNGRIWSTLIRPCSMIYGSGCFPACSTVADHCVYGWLWVCEHAYMYCARHCYWLSMKGTEICSWLSLVRLVEYWCWACQLSCPVHVYYQLHVMSQDCHAISGPKNTTIHPMPTHA